MSMSEYAIGIIVGILFGMSMGLSILIALREHQKPWTELTEKEKKTRKLAIGSGIAILLLGIVSLSWFLLL
jgi:hypothetical protein